MCISGAPSGGSWLPGYKPRFIVHRSDHYADSFRPVANESCQNTKALCTLAGATHYATADGSCQCNCTPSAPIFDQCDVQCVDGRYYSPCRMLSSSAGGLHCVPLPQSAGSMGGVDIAPANASAAPALCVGAQRVETMTELGWVPVRAAHGIFAVTDVKKATGIHQRELMWMGTSEWSAFFAGKLVRLTAQCDSGGKTCAAICINGYDEHTDPPSTFGVIADNAYNNESGSKSVQLQQTWYSEDAKEMSDAMYAILASVAILITCTLGAVAMWLSCWRMRKRKLAERIEKQMMYGHSGQKAADASYSQSDACSVCCDVELDEPNATQMQQHGGAEQGGQHNASSQPPPPPVLHAVARRRLYFSNEFFDERHMRSPPPVAQEFLYEVRRMVDCARLRIRAKRHVPTLDGIVELSEAEHTEHEREARRGESAGVAVAPLCSASAPCERRPVANGWASHAAVDDDDAADDMLMGDSAAVTHDDDGGDAHSPTATGATGATGHSQNSGAACKWDLSAATADNSWSVPMALPVTHGVYIA